MTPEQIKTALDTHTKWLRAVAGGVRADLRDADLRNADLSGADLRGADLSGADLRNADLSESHGPRFAQIAWSSHGECGRQLLCVRLPGGLRYFCGCFAGSADDLHAYIDRNGHHLAESRRLAMWIVTALCEGVTP